MFLAVPAWLLDRRAADWDAYALTSRPLSRGLLCAGALAAIVFPLFLAGFVAYYETVCGRGWLPSLCRTWQGWAGASFRLPDDPVNLALAQLVVVALPEEFFYRGYLQTRLAERWPHTWRLPWARVGPAWLASAALFALAHVAVDGNPLRLAVFFPALLFGWMREATGSILAGTLLHALSNLVSDTLHRSFF